MGRTRMITFDRAAYDALRRDGEERYPEESCGILLAHGRGDGREVGEAVCCANASAASRRERYEIDAREILRVQRDARARDLEIVGFYHSHADHPARPSRTDLADAYWPGHSYVITRVAAGRAEETASFVLRGDPGGDKRFEEEEVRVT
jgi:proteasome lid subunit RPN8/RPN11